MYFTDRGIEELEERRAAEHVAVSWLAARMREFVDVQPEYENAMERFATFLARYDDDPDEIE